MSGKRNVSVCRGHGLASALYMSDHILLEGIYFVLSYSTHICNAYIAGSLLKIKKRKMKHAFNKEKAHSIILKK